ncbi:thiolase family protein [Nonomuraea sp. NPDC052116]|uniref:thiolase family protein n=1 Tax=Nonomuraea sp. NPDC052116 TaxID=3155665 RepID=UPI00342999AE
MPESFVVSGVRTPIGRYGGALAHVRPDDLAALVVGEAVARAGIAPDLVDEVVLGAANQAGDVVVAGGVESMTRAPWVTEKPAKAFAKPGPSFDTSIGWRFTNPRFDAATTASMPQTAETVARRWGLTREELDAYALRSHERAVTAIKEGRFTGEIVPVPTGAGVVDTDEGPRPDTSLERLARLRPVNGPDGVVTAGNSSSLNDGAAAVVVVSDRFLERHGLTPRARLVAAANAGVAPEIMGVGPVPATRKALERSGGRRGLATMCVGVGQGSALLVERP